MNKGIETILYPVNDLNQTKKLFNQLLETTPIVDQPYYVGYRIGNQDIGLVPNGSGQSLAGPLAFYTVSDIRVSLEALKRWSSDGAGCTRRGWRQANRFGERCRWQSHRADPDAGLATKFEALILRVAVCTEFPSPVECR